MKQSEFLHILAAVIIFTIVGSFAFIIESEWYLLPKIFFFALIIISISILAKKIAARALDTDIEHEIWKFSRYGLRAGHYLKKPIPLGIILPLVLTIFSLGWLKFSAFLTYEATALKRRSAKRHGFYSHAELTEWHNGLIGAAGIIACFAIAVISYFLPWNLEYLAKLAVFYAISNLIPVSKLDGIQIFFGSRVLWTALTVIALIFSAYAFVI